MAPNKFEEHIKKQLQKREIKPSSNAWEKLSGQINEVQATKKKPFIWYAVAASIIAIVLISTFYLNAENLELETNTQIVSSPEKTIEEKKNTSIVVEEVEPDQLVVIEEEKPEPKIEVKAEAIVPVDTTESFLVANELTIESHLDDVPQNTSEEIINSKILEVVAQAELLEKQNDALTDAEVDSLLRRAQQEILTDKLFREDRSVDAMALLTEVEDELDKSFRNQIFESLKSGFLKVRTAVADRNN